MKTSTLIPVVAYLAFSGTVNAAPVAGDNAVEKRWCIWGWGTTCGTTTTSQPAASSAVKSIAAVPSSSAKASAASSASAVKSSAVASAVKSAAPANPTSWSSCKDFDWSRWNSGWTWGGGYSLKYVQDWYVDNYGYNPPQGMSWSQVTSLVNKFGDSKTIASPPKTSSKYTKGCDNPWTKAPTSTSKAVSASVTSKAAVTPSSSVKASVSVAASSAASAKASSASSSAASSAASAAAAPAASSVSSAAAPAASSASSAAAAPAASSASSASSAAAVPAASSASSAAAAPAASSAEAASSAAASSAAAAAPSASDAPSGGNPGTGAGTPGTNDGSASASSSSSAAPAATPVSQINGYTYGGCAQEISGRLLPDVQTSSNTQTIESCTALCMSYGFAVAGLEYGNECYCGDIADATNALLSGECKMPCAGDSTQICGGPNAISWYSNPNVVPATVQLPAGWTTYGVVGEAHADRTLTFQLWSSQSNTVETCAQGCADAGYTVSGTEYSSECFCGNGFSNGGGARLDDSSAFMKCSGDLAQTCGGPSVLSVVSALGQNIPQI